MRNKTKYLPVDAVVGICELCRHEGDIEVCDTCTHCPLGSGIEDRWQYKGCLRCLPERNLERRKTMSKFFKCPECGHDVLEEIATEAVISYDVEDITLDDSGTELDFEYSSDITVSDLCADSIRRQCGECGRPVSDSELKTAAGGYGR